jgi:hypothetical protein
MYVPMSKLAFFEPSLHCQLQEDKATRTVCYNYIYSNSCSTPLDNFVSTIYVGVAPNMSPKHVDEVVFPLETTTVELVRG